MVHGCHQGMHIRRQRMLAGKRIRFLNRMAVQSGLNMVFIGGSRLNSFDKKLPQS